MQSVQNLFRRYTFTTADGFTMPYRLYIPKNYDCGERYPLVVYLHGAGSRGEDNERQLDVLEYAFRNEHSPLYGAVILAPQMGEKAQWVDAPYESGQYRVTDTPESVELRTVLAIMGYIKSFCNIDEDRVYAIGTSLGGFGVWDLLVRHGKLFAAGIPVCGGCDATHAASLAQIPIWAFHGSEDKTVLPDGDRLMYACIRKNGGILARYTEYTGCEHAIWDLVYSDREVFSWLFSQSRLNRRLAWEKAARNRKKAIAAGGGIGALLLTGAAIWFGSRKRRK